MDLDIDTRALPARAQSTRHERSGSESRRNRAPAWAAAAAGATAAGASLGAGELSARLADTVSPVVAVGDRVIRSTPGGVSRWAISTFGSGNKPTLVAGIVAASLLFGTVLGLVGRRNRAVAAAGVVGFGVVGMVAVARQPLTSPGAAIAAVAPATAVGAVCIVGLLSLARATRPSTGTPSTDAGRRVFLISGAAVLALAAASAAAGRRLATGIASAATRAMVVLPRARRPATPVPAGASLPIPGVSPIITPNADFYRIDERLVVPRYDAAGWSLWIHGMVDRPFILTFDDVLDLPLVEEHVTLACVSNEIGGPLVGTATWLGYPLARLLERAGVQRGADQVIGRAVDQFTAGFPLAAAVDGRAALVAVGMNGEPLPHKHGFPLRLVVAGLYGYVSATKWLTEIEVTTFEERQAYWVKRGWAVEAPVKLQSRIDVPRDGQSLAPGEQVIAGVAWAPTRGIARVQVRVDDAQWHDATLADAIDDATWRQWFSPWQADSGRHHVAVRATSEDGELQDERVRPPYPDGATGWHTITVKVEP